MHDSSLEGDGFELPVREHGAMAPTVPCKQMPDSYDEEIGTQVKQAEPSLVHPVLVFAPLDLFEKTANR